MTEEMIATIQTGEFGLDEKPTKRTLISLHPKNDNFGGLPCVRFFLDELNITIRPGSQSGAPILKDDIDFFKNALDFVSKLKKVVSV